MNGNGGEHMSPTGCRECGSSLAHDQRYCLRCGARRGALPAYVAQAIARIREQGVAAVPHRPLVAEPAEQEAGQFDAWLRAPRAAAVAVIGTLGFGAILGSLVGESAASGPQGVLAVVSHPSQAPPVAASGGGSAGSSASGGGGTQTITVGSTTPPPASASPAAPSSTPATTSPAGGNTPTSGPLPPVRHVFMIVLSNQGYNQTFGQAASDPYLARTLVRQGELVPNYYAVAGGSLANEIALISGQGPTPDTVNDCPVYRNVSPADRGAKGQVLGNGCVYPKWAKTLPAELAAAKLTWKAYIQVKGAQARREACGHPGLGSAARQPTAQNPYATWSNPFLYFHSLIDKHPCLRNDAPLTELAADLRTASTTPTLSYVVPDVCHDGSDSPCAPNAPAGMGPADAFLKSVVPKIERSPAYKAGGLIAITFDQAPQTGPNADQSSCCNNPTYPNLPPPPSSSTTSTTSTTGTTGTTSTTGTTGTTGTTSTTGTTGTTSTSTTGTSTTGTTSTTTTSTTGTSTTPTTTTSTTALGSGQTNPTGGGGQVGLLLISRYVTPNTLEVTDYFNHFSLLASIEELFGLKRLGYAADPLLPVFGPAVYDNYTPG